MHDTSLLNLTQSNKQGHYSYRTIVYFCTKNQIMSKFTIFALFLLSAVAFGFAPVNQQHRPASQLEAANKPIAERVSQFVATTAAVVATSPLMALAEEVDDYEYGSVDAPIGIAVAGGVLAILTAAVPVFMQGGEEAFEEMRERDSGNWGTGRSDSLNKRR